MQTTTKSLPSQIRSSSRRSAKKFGDLTATFDRRSTEVLDLEHRAIEREAKAQTTAARREALEARRADAICPVRRTV
jgi:hypothetical protein